MSFQPFRPPHSEDCPECYPPPSWKSIAVLVLVVIAISVTMLCLRWLA
jgi:hypothetical protein